MVQQFTWCSYFLKNYLTYCSKTYRCDDKLAIWWVFPHEKLFWLLQHQWEPRAEHQMHGNMYVCYMYLYYMYVCYMYVYYIYVCYMYFCYIYVCVILLIKLTALVSFLSSYAPCLLQISFNMKNILINFQFLLYIQISKHLIGL